MGKSFNYVRGIYEAEITLTINDIDMRAKITSLGGKRYFFTPTAFSISVINEQQKLELLQKLLDMQICFVGGEYGWPPAAIVSDLREKGLLHGSIKEITWSGPRRPLLRER
jgi:hypothetical protein